MKLLEIRKQIDSVDSDIINLLSKRAVLVSAASKLKKDEQGVRDPKRVEQVIERVKAKASAAGLDFCDRRESVQDDHRLFHKSRAEGVPEKIPLTISSI